MIQFRHCETFSKIFRGPPPGGLNMTPAVNFYASGYWFDLMQCEKILRQCIEMGYNWVMY